MCGGSESAESEEVLCRKVGGEEDEEDRLEEVQAETGRELCALQGGAQTGCGWSPATSRWSSGKQIRSLRW